MAIYPVGLDEAFLALSDPTRRRILHRLGAGDATVGELAAGVPMTLPSFLKHIHILERGGLVRTAKSGRVRTCSLDRPRFEALTGWMAEQQEAWERRTDRLQRFVEQATAPEKENDHGP